MKIDPLNIKRIKEGMCLVKIIKPEEFVSKSGIIMPTKAQENIKFTKAEVIKANGIFDIEDGDIIFIGKNAGSVNTIEKDDEEYRLVMERDLIYKEV